MRRGREVKREFWNNLSVAVVNEWIFLLSLSTWKSINPNKWLWIECKIAANEQMTDASAVQLNAVDVYELSYLYRLMGIIAAGLVFN